MAEPTWTKDRPTEPGWYWVRWHPDYNLKPEIACVSYRRFHCQDTTELRVKLLGGGESAHLNCFVAFAGPIPMPEEAERG